MLEVSTDAFSNNVVIDMLCCVGAGAVCNAIATCDEDGSLVVEFEVLCDESTVFRFLRGGDLFVAETFGCEGPLEVIVRVKPALLAMLVQLFLVFCEKA